MSQERFITLLTKELLNEITIAESDELKLLVQQNPDLFDKKAIIKKYWKRKSISSAANTAKFKKLMHKIRAEEVSLKVILNEKQEITNRRGSSIKIWMGTAAMILVIIGASSLYYIARHYPTGNGLSANWRQLSTRPSVKSIITLPDSTVVYLNSSSTLKYPDGFNGKTREVYLDGEAYFDVHKDHHHPFIIHTHRMNVRVLGTAFNIKSYHNDPLSETTLIRGSIEVTLNDHPSDRIILKPADKLVVQNYPASKKQTNLSADYSSRNSAGKAPAYSLTTLTYFPNNKKTIVETSWVQNKLVFSDEDFTQLSVQLERWYGIKIVFENDRIKHHRFSGLFEKETLSEALDALKIIEHFNYQILDSTVYIH
ncbi:MAG: FecR family protein [Bacteroidota bacterium]|nr:FecR family protein [Bacteroidota bacterium]